MRPRQRRHRRGVGGARQDVAVELPHRIDVAVLHPYRVGHGLKDVVDTSISAAARRAAGRLSATTTRQHVAEIRRAPAHGDHHRPVLVDEPHPQDAGDVGGSEHRLHAGFGFGCAGIDGQHVGTSMIGEAQGTVQHPVRGCHTADRRVDHDVVDVRTAAPA